MSKVREDEPLTQDRLKSRLTYDPQTGVLRRRSDLTGRFKGKGKPVGALSHGYLTTRIDGKIYPVARLAWLYMTGMRPDGVIDHINGDRQDNRWDNLRCVSQQVNTENQRRARSDNLTGFLGVTHAWRVNKSNPYAAAIYTNGQAKHLGYFSTPEKAHEAYLSAKRHIHEGCSI